MKIEEKKKRNLEIAMKIIENPENSWVLFGEWSSCEIEDEDTKTTSTEVRVIMSLCQNDLDALSRMLRTSKSVFDKLFKTYLIANNLVEGSIESVTQEFDL